MENSYRFFENRACKYFPCHMGVEELNCLFCYCPLYHQKNCPGNPKFVEKEGQTVKVCADCTFPHQPEMYDVVVRLLKNRKELF